jgi:predicted lysophospholipase L1 biosynthesis ABC-type transport system permease subunit
VFFLVDTREQKPRREPQRIPRWVGAFVLLVVVGIVTGGVIGVIALFTAICLLIDRVLPAVAQGGLRDYRQ